ncbi:MAG: GTPase HflX [Planctomycetota bacterium]|jgi:GTP-binding protein HflX
MPDALRDNRSVRAERAYLVSLLPPGTPDDGDPFRELRSLALAAGTIVVGQNSQRRDRPVPATYFGKGKAREIGEKAAAVDADLVVADHDLTPAQIRNLETLIQLKVIDRTELILDIFANRARTLQARLQVELAQLEYTLPRLKRMWTHLSRIEGGIGMRGPGEKQLEADRRVANRRIRDLRKRLSEIRSRRHRAVESRGEHFKLSLVGYTNAGKSTLMNRLTDAQASVKDRLFETLDTRTRAWLLPGGRRVLLSDTVGFIRDLPHHLVASFHATLEETLYADLLLHVVDVSAADIAGQMQAVNGVLDAIGAAFHPSLIVFNKIDLAHSCLDLETLKEKVPDHVTLSAKTGEGVDRLGAWIVRFIEEEMVEVDLDLPRHDGAVEAAVARWGRLISSEYREDGVRLRALLRRNHVDAIRRLAGLPPAS